MKTPAIDLPDQTTMPDQKSRSALTWYKMQAWTEAQRKQYFSTSAHAEGMEATASAYNNENGSTVKPTIQVQSQSKSQPIFEKLIREIMKRYPSADQYHFDQLETRHYGVMTGRIEKWHVEGAAEDKKAPQDLLNSFIRDLTRVYPNWQNWHMEPLTYTDWGEFMLDGKIKSWEKMSYKSLSL